MGCTHQECRLCSPTTCYKLDPKVVAVVIANLDLLYCILFFLMSLYLSHWIERRDKEVNDTTLTPSDFTLQVNLLPVDCTTVELKELFDSKYKLADGSGACARVKIAYDENRFLSSFIKQSELKEACENAEAAVCRSDSKKSRDLLEKCRAAMTKNSVYTHRPNCSPANF